MTPALKHIVTVESGLRVLFKCKNVSNPFKQILTAIKNELEQLIKILKNKIKVRNFYFLGFGKKAFFNLIEKCLSVIASLESLSLLPLKSKITKREIDLLIRSENLVKQLVKEIKTGV